MSETPKGKSDTSVTETPKSRTKTVGVRPKKGWSKVKITAGRSKKRKVVSSSDTKFDVEEDVLNIIPSATKKSVGKKTQQNVDNVPINKVSSTTLKMLKGGNSFFIGGWPWRERAG